MNTIKNFKLVFGLLTLSIIYNCSSDSDESGVIPKDTSFTIGNEIVMTENNGDVTNVITVNMDEMEKMEELENTNNNPSNDSTNNNNNNNTPDNSTNTPDNNTNNPNDNTTNTPNDSTNNPEVRVLTEAEMAKLDFATISIFDKTEANYTRARKWTKPVKLFLSGAFGNDEINFINDFAKELASISSEIDLSIVDNVRDSNVEMYIATKQQYADEGRNFLGGRAPGFSEAGRANISWGIPSYEINGTKIWADPSQRSYDTVIKHEILHILGIGHNNTRDSVMNPTPSPDPTLSENDIFAIKTLYSGLIKASTLEEGVRDIVENNIEEFFE